MVKAKMTEFSRMLFHCYTKLSNSKERNVFFHKGDVPKKIMIQTARCGPSSIHLVKITCEMYVLSPAIKFMDPVTLGVEYYVDINDLCDTVGLKCSIADDDPKTKLLMFRFFDADEYLKNLGSPSHIYNENGAVRLTTYQHTMPSFNGVSSLQSVCMVKPPPELPIALPQPEEAKELIKDAVAIIQAAKREKEVQEEKALKRQQRKEAVMRAVIKQMAKSKFAKRCRSKMKQFRGPCLLCFEVMVRPELTRKIKPCYHCFHRSCYGTYEWQWVQKRKDTPPPCPQCAPKPSSGRRSGKN